MKRIPIPVLSNAVKANVETVSNKMSDYMSPSGNMMPMIVMSYFMIRSSYDREEIQDEVGASDALWAQVSRRLQEEIGQESSIFSRKVKLVSNYLKLNHSLIIH